MKNITFIVLFLMALAISSGFCSPDSVLHDLAHVWAARSANEKVYWVVADINNDGINDLLVTSSGSKDQDTSNGYEWIVYLGKSDGSYAQISGTYQLYSDETPTKESTVTMGLNHYWVGLISEIGKYGLLYMTTGSGGQAKSQLMAIVIDVDKFSVVPVGEPANAESNFETMRLRLNALGAPETHEANASDL